MVVQFYGYNKWNSNDQKPIAESYQLECLRKSAIVHKNARKHLQEYINELLQQNKPINYTDICEVVEHKVDELFRTLELFHKDDTNVKKGMGFPVGISSNHIAAHDSAILYDTRSVGPNDIIKIDFGTHYDGYIIDSAFTIYSNPMFENLAKATYDATMSTIKMVGPDSVINDLSINIKEVIESYEVDINGITYPIKPIRNLGGHNIHQNIIHGGTIILCAPSEQNSYKTQRIQTEQSYAIETFASTGKGVIVEDHDLESTHFMVRPNVQYQKLVWDVSKKALNYIKKDRGFLPFASRWVYKNMEKSLQNKTSSGIKELINKGIIKQYPPCVDVQGSYTSQYEHTIFVSDKGVENLSISTDY